MGGGPRPDRMIHRGSAAARTGGRQGLVARSSEQGLWPLRSMETCRRGQKRERGARGSISGLTKAQAAVWWPGDGDETTANEMLGGDRAQV
jgi:hypothetical protein